MHVHNSRLRTIDTFFVLDLDRCLVNTEKLFVGLLDVIEERTGITAGEIEIARREYESDGGVFDIARYIMTFFDGKGMDGPAEWNEIKHLFVAEAHGQDMMEPFAAKLLAQLDESQLQYCILTFGADAWQLTKLEAAGLSDVPHMVTHDIDKGRLIASWQLASGHFLIPTTLAGGAGLVAGRIVFIDDKPVSFDRIPADVFGICAIAPGAVWAKERLEALPDNVRVVDGINSAIELLKSHNYFSYIDKT